VTPGSGTGAGTVNYSVAANPTGSPRTGTITIAGQPFTVTQQPATTTCTLTLDHAFQSFGSAGGAGTPIGVTATPGGCGGAWTATTSDPWITGVTPGSGTGAGTVNYSVAANPTGSPRTGTITIAGQPFTVTQQPATTTCSLTLDHASESFTALGGAGTPIVINATPGGCGAWTATSNVLWITAVTPGSGTGNGTVNFIVTANLLGARTGTLTIAGWTFTVSQAAVLP
jgi:hypothetical protein